MKPNPNKKEMKQLYLDGWTIQKIAEKFNLKERTIYLHIQPLASKDKVLHLKNRLGGVK